MKMRLSAIAAILSISGLITLPVTTMADTANTNGTTSQAATAASKKKKKRTRHEVQTHENQNNAVTRADVAQLVSDKVDFLPFDMDVPGKAFVSTGPYVGVPFTFAGGNLIINSPSVNTDVQLLTVRKSILDTLDKRGRLVKERTNSHLLFSGVVEGVASYYAPGGAPSTSSVDLGTVGLDAFFIGPSDWTLGYFELNYESANAANDIFTSTNRYTVANSRVFINRAFITVGNFQKSPFYGSVGQFYVPFGVYSSVMVSAPMTKSLTRTKARALLVGFQQQDSKTAFFGSAYAFRGDSHATSRAKIDNGGLNVGFKFDQSVFSKYVFQGKVGVGVIANIADSQGMQLLNGFATNAATEQLQNRVPGYNAYAKFTLGQHVDVIGEIVAAANSFGSNDMTYNGRPAKPWASDIEIAYSFEAFGRPSSVGANYSTTSQALALGLPLKRTGVVFNTSIWRHTIQSLEFRHDRQYAASATATGAGGAASTAQMGKGDNAVTAQFDYYF